MSGDAVPALFDCTSQARVRLGESDQYLEFLEVIRDQALRLFDEGNFAVVAAVREERVHGVLLIVQLENRTFACEGAVLFGQAHARADSDIADQRVPG